MRDYLQGHPQDVALLVSVELCSLTLQHGDDSMANIVSSGLFGDGAAAVVMVGSDRAADVHGGVDVVDSRSALYPDTTDALGWDIGGSGFRIVLAASLADIVEQHLGPGVVDLLAAHGLKVADVGTWVAHTGGPRILQAAARALEPARRGVRGELAVAGRVGNLSLVRRPARAGRRARRRRSDPRVRRRAVRHRSRACAPRPSCCAGPRSRR